VSTATRPHASPSSAGLEARLLDFLAGSLSGFPWPVAVGRCGGEVHTFGGDLVHWCGQPLTIHFHTEAAISDVLSLDGFGFLERFLLGEVDLAGNLFVLTELGEHLRLRLSWRQILSALVRNNLYQTVRRARVNVTSHYDIPQEVLETYLDRKYMAYSCAIFERPREYDPAELVAAGAGEHDDFDSLEKAQ
jgi:hypothetical protein